MRRRFRDRDGVVHDVIVEVFEDWKKRHYEDVIKCNGFSLAGPGDMTMDSTSCLACLATTVTTSR